MKQSLFKGKKDGKYCDMEKQHKVLQKLLQEYFLPKGGGVDHLSLKHKVFLHYFISFGKVNFPRYINGNQLGTMVGKYINGSTLYNMHLVKEVIRMDTDLQESNILSNLMDNFPPICKRDPLDVRAHYVYEHFVGTRVFHKSPIEF